jgi:hypothetical protein
VAGLAEDHDDPEPEGRRTEHFAMAAGMDPEKEKTLLHKWRNVLRSR